MNFTTGKLIETLEDMSGNALDHTYIKIISAKLVIITDAPILESVGLYTLHARPAADSDPMYAFLDSDRWEN